MLNKINFYKTVIINTPLFIIAFIFNFFLVFIQISALKYNPISFSEVFCYGFISSNLFLLIASNFAMYKKYDLFLLYEKNNFKKQISIILSGYLISLLMLIPNLLIISLNIPNNISTSSLIKILLNFIIIWSSSNIIALCIGTTIGNIFKKGYSILIALILYSLFIIVLFSASSTAVYFLLNIFDDFTIIFNNRTEIIMDSKYFIDKLFIILLSGLILSISNLFNKKKQFKYLPVFLFIIALFITMYLYQI